MGVGLFLALYREFDFDEIMSILQSDMHISWIILSMLIGVVSHVARALRWRLQLKMLDIRPSLFTSCNAIFGMYAFNLILPRFGELWRCSFMASHEKTSFSKVLGSVLGDRFADTLTVAIIAIAVFFSQINVLQGFLQQSQHSDGEIASIFSNKWLYVILFLIIIFAVIIFLTYRGKNRLGSIIKNFISKMWDGFRSVISMKTGKISFLIYTIIIWGSYLMQLYVCFFAFDWMSHLGISQALVLFVMGSIGMAVPVQGGIGPWHAAVIYGLMFYGIGREEAGAFALIAHGSQMLVMILLGVYTTIAIMVEQYRIKRLTTDKNNT